MNGSGQVVGWDLELAQDVCSVLGVSCTIANVTFDDIIPALLEKSPKYVMSFSSFTPTASREASGIDFITYYQAGKSWLAKVGGPTITSGLADVRPLGGGGVGHRRGVGRVRLHGPEPWGWRHLR